jgi:uncharacterized DUF497 family protein
MRVTWDPNKEQKNIKKHNVSFSYAAEVFHDPLRIVDYDKEHSSGEPGGEDRYINIGKARDEVVLFVVETEIDDDTVQIITARKATRKERDAYVNG